MNFDKYNDNKSNSSSTGAARTAYVGMAALKVLGINPTKEELGEIIGEETAAKFNTDYALRQNYNQIEVRPLTIWVQDVDEQIAPTIINYELGQPYIVTKDGLKNVFFSDNGKTCYAADEAGMPAWATAPYYKSRIGEAQWYSLVFKLFKWDQNDETTFMEFLLDNKLDFDSIYAGNFAGVRAYVQYLKQQDASVIAPLTVKVEHTENGTRYRQRVLSGSDYIYSNYSGVTEPQIAALKAKEVSQQTQGYQLTNDGYFIGKMTEFDADVHMAHVPKTGDAISELLNL